jgi:hypothetical protein
MRGFSAPLTAASEINQLKTKLVKFRAELECDQASLKDEFAGVEREIVQTLEAQGVTSIQPDNFIKFTKEHDRLTQLLSSLNQKSTSVTNLKNAVLSTIVDLNNGWQQEFQDIQNKLLSIFHSTSSLKVYANFKGDKGAFISKMEEVFKGNGIRKETYQALAQKYPDFSEMYRDLENASKETRSKSQVFQEIFLDNLSTLLTYQVPNSYEIVYREKPLKSHSVGQRASALMLFILSQNENDIIFIDQPEDDLDNQVIYDEVVKLIRQLKPKQQFIFATHNANFPVLGDAELILTCSFADDKMIINSGSIDCKETQKQVVNIMEGGIEAFDKRKTIYQLWKNN